MKPQFKLLKLLNIAEMYIIDLEHYEKVRQRIGRHSCIQLYLLSYQKDINEEILYKVMQESISIARTEYIPFSEIKFNYPIESI